jgi:16S rRNA G966 N2-methylase RsmD
MSITIKNKNKKKNKKNRFKTMKRKVYNKTFTTLSKSKITNIIYNFSKDDIIKDYEKLKTISCDNINNLDKSGSKFINYFTAIERLDTKGKRGFTFFDIVHKFNTLYHEKYYFYNAINSAFNNKFFTFDTEKKIKSLKSFFSLYMGNVGIFRPIITKSIICEYKPKKMLDFTMGWGGRLVGACSENIEHYIGIDMNHKLKPLYEKMENALKQLSSTKITLMFKDALKVDYSKLDYDMVLTSPPYYNIEIYRNNKVLTEQEWNETFYEPIFSVTFKYLKKNGYYCLNVPTSVYNNVCVKILGKCDKSIPLGKPLRKQTDTYSEYIYIWKK